MSGGTHQARVVGSLSADTDSTSPTSSKYKIPQQFHKTRRNLQNPNSTPRCSNKLERVLTIRRMATAHIILHQEWESSSSERKRMNALFVFVILLTFTRSRASCKQTHNIDRSQSFWSRRDKRNVMRIHVSCGLLGIHSTVLTLSGELFNVTLRVVFV